MRNILKFAALAATALVASPALAQNCQLGSVGCTVNGGDNNSVNPIVAPVTNVTPVTTATPVTTVAPVVAPVTTVAPVVAPVIAPVTTATSGTFASGNSASNSAVLGSGNSSSSSGASVGNTSASTGPINNDNRSSADNSVVNASDNRSVNSAAGNTTTTAVTVEGDTYNNPRQHRIVSSAWAPGLTSGIGTCLGSASGGLSTGIFGISGGSTTRDEVCTVINLSTAVNALGYTREACELLFQDKRVAAAFTASGTRCNGTPVAAAPAKVEAPVKALAATTVVPTPVRDRTPIAERKFISEPVVQPVR